MNTLSAPPLYGQLTDKFRELILSGQLKPGQKLPSFTEMRERHGVSQATVNRVHGLLEAEGLIARRRGAGTFVCDPTEATLANGERDASFLSNAVVLFTPFGKPKLSHRSSGWLEWISQAAGDAVREAGMHAVTLNPGVRAAEIDRLIAEKPFGFLISANPSDVAATPEITRKLLHYKLPVVAFGDAPAESQCDHVSSDHESGAYQLTRFLIGRGRTRIANVRQIGLDKVWVAQRHLGYERAMREAGSTALPPLSLPPIQLLRSAQLAASDHYPDARERAQILAQDRQIFETQTRNLAGYLVESLNGDDALDGLLATTDRDTFALAAACQLFGKQPNRDIDIAGYDNYFADCEERALTPFLPVATIDKNNRALGAAMVQLLLDRAQDRLENAPQACVIEPRLVIPQPSHSL